MESQEGGNRNTEVGPTNAIRLSLDYQHPLKNKRLFSIFLGAVFGPLTYFSAVSGGLATVSSLTILFLISLFWSLLMLIYSQS